MSPIERSAGGGGSPSAGGLVKLFDSTLGVAAATIDTGAGGIAGGHADLSIYLTARTTEAVVASAVLFTLNADAGANYENPRVQMTAATVTGANPAGTNNFFCYISGATAAANYPGVAAIIIPSYDQTTFFKVGTVMGGALAETGSMAIMTSMFGWRSTAAITRLTATSEAGNLVAGSRLVVYGTQ